MLAVDNGDPEFGGEPGDTFRIVPSKMWVAENNLSIANAGFDELRDSTDQDGVLRS